MTSNVVDAMVGRVVDGRYRILSHLADGGMASVWVALDQRLDREVALKIMRPGLASDAVFVERFRREARSAAKLNHPNIVAVHDQGEHDGDVFLVMELVRGITLRDVITKEAPLTPREAMAICESMLAALNAAHKSGILHRDIKPENVIIREDGEVKVADFGLARVISNNTTGGQSGMVLGTVAYLSPEQVEHGTSDERSDIYAAGLVLGEMLTGRQAVQGSTPIQVAYQHVHSRVPAPSVFVDGLPAELDEVALTLTARSPEDRPATAGEAQRWVRELRRALPDEELDVVPTVLATPRPQEYSQQATRELDLSAGPSVSEPSGPRAGANRPVRTGIGNPTTALPVQDMPRPGGGGHGPGGRSDAHGSHAAGREGDSRSSRRPWIIAAVIVLLVALFGGWYAFAGPAAQTTTPAVAGKPVDAARTTVRNAQLTAVEKPTYSETVPKGTVIDTDPKAGAQLRKGSDVSLLVSRGPERHAIPDLRGKATEEARQQLKAQSLSVGKIEEVWHDNVPAGRIIRQSLPVGQQVKRDTKVDLTVSKGREPVKVVGVVGKQYREAKQQLTDAGLIVVRGEDVNSDVAPVGEVVQQNPADGVLYRGDTVTLVVSKGPVQVEVPDVIGQDRASATETLTKAGFKVDVTETFLGTNLNQVARTSPGPGSMAPKGSKVTVTIV